MTVARSKIAAVVLAAGYSSRMGEFKPCLPLGDRTVVEHILARFEAAGIREVVLVTGHRASLLTDLLHAKQVRLVFNPRYPEGMYSSIVAGTQVLSPQTDACFVLPADIPLVRSTTLQALIETYERDKPLITYPVFGGRRGHPPLIDRRLFEGVLASSGEGGLRRVLSQYDSRAAEVKVPDEGIHLDVDTPEDYARLCMLAGPANSNSSDVTRRQEPVVLGSTQSVCPTCLDRVEAQRIREDGAVYLTKTCPVHGNFKTVLWRGEPSYESWSANSKRTNRVSSCVTEIDRGCPFDCGLCSDHKQSTCCVLLEVTQRCNLKCPFCFATAPQRQSDPGLNEIESWLNALLKAGGPFNLQLSGGEPTLRDDLPEIVTLARSMGFNFVQVNTNGVRLAADDLYLHKLREAGLDCVFLQFDGVTDNVYERIRGKALLQAKKNVIQRCNEEHLGVVLVPTLVPGVNASEIGDIIHFAIENMPTVRAVHFQPVSYFGRYPSTPADHDRITLPEVMRSIEWQTQGKIKASDFYPPSAENAYCSFQGKFTLQANGALKAAPRPTAPSCCTPLTGISRAPASPDLVQLGGRSRAQSPESQRARDFVAHQWTFPTHEETHPATNASPTNIESLDAFLRSQRRNTLSISGMAFQDAWNLDLERLRQCFIHVVSPDRRLVPLCAYNLTDAHGNALYRDHRCDGAAAEVCRA